MKRSLTKSIVRCEINCLSTTPSLLNSSIIELIIASDLSLFSPLSTKESNSLCLVVLATLILLDKSSTTNDNGILFIVNCALAYFLGTSLSTRTNIKDCSNTLFFCPN